MQKNTTIDAAMSYGLILGLLFSANFFVSLYSQFISQILTFVIIYQTYKFTVNFRNKELGGVMSYGKCLGFIVLMFIFASIIAAFAHYVFCRFISPDYLDKMSELVRNTPEYKQFLPEYAKILQSYGLSQAQTEQLLNVSITPALFTVAWFILDIVLGFGLGLILSFFTRKEKI